jgi:hypothetical protein
MDEIQIRWKDESQNKYALKADNIHEIYPSYNCEYSPFITKQSNTELYIQPESVIKIINSGVHKVFHTKSGIAVDINDNIDTGSVTAGTTYYTYICDEYNGNASFIVSTNSVTPSGYIADEVKQIGRFNTTTSGYIDQASMWDISCGVEKFIYVATSFYVATTGNDITGDGSSGNPWATVGKAISYLNYFRLNTTVTINVASGHYNESTIYITNTPSNGLYIRIIGASILTKNMTSLQSCSGSAGAWSQVLNLNSVAGISVGDFVGVKVISGGTNNAAVYGYCAVTNVDTGNNRITVLNKNYAASTPSGAITATVYVFTTVLNFNSVDGIYIQDAVNDLLNNIALNNTGAKSSAGIMVNASSNGNGSGYVGAWLGASNFSNNFRAVGPITARVNYAFASGGDNGFRCDNNGFLYVSAASLSVGNANGLFSYHGGQISLTDTISCGNSTNGAYLEGRGYLVMKSGNTLSNNPTGVFCAHGSFAFMSGVTAIGNNTNYTPAANTIGINNSYILVE